MLTGQSTLIVIPEHKQKMSRLWFWYQPTGRVIRDSIAKCPVTFRCQGNGQRRMLPSVLVLKTDRDVKVNPNLIFKIQRALK